MKLTLLRHGETDGSRRDLYYGAADIPALPESLAALHENAAAYPRAKRYYTSGLLRTEQTLAALSARCPLFLVSNCQDGYIEAFFQAHGLGRYFTDYENPGRTGLPKADKMEFIVQKAVELGVSRIVPYLSKNCVSRPDKTEKKVERWRKIAAEAAKQCGRGAPPKPSR